MRTIKLNGYVAKKGEIINEFPTEITEYDSNNNFFWVIYHSLLKDVNKTGVIWGKIPCDNSQLAIITRYSIFNKDRQEDISPILTHYSRTNDGIFWARVENFRFGKF